MGAGSANRLGIGAQCRCRLRSAGGLTEPGLRGTVGVRGAGGSGAPLWTSYAPELVQLPVDQKLQRDGGAQLASMMALLLQPAVSPDGRWVAFTTAVLPKMPQERHGLLLVDTRDKQRQVKRVPFPEWK